MKITTNIFLVFGYGVPKDILKDENYNFYQKMVFNKIYDISVKRKSKKSLIIFCGGKTDMFKPYQRTEADEMIRFFAELIKKRPMASRLTKSWILIPEKTSLSTLENLMNSKNIIKKRAIKNARLTIFCEQTRKRRISVLAKRIFGASYSFQVVPIDFDVSANRYLSPAFIDRKEKTELRHSLSALKSPENMRKHHEIFIEKFEYFRKMGHKKHTDAVKKWWAQKLAELEK